MSLLAAMLPSMSRHSAVFRHRTLVTAGDFCWNRHLLFDLVLAFAHDAS